MSETPPYSTFKCPSDRELGYFRLSQLGNDTVRLYLEKGFSLVICCRGCKRTVEWTPPKLLERFGDRVGLKLKDLVPRLSCSGTGGCGSKDIAVVAHFYDHPWQWPPALDFGEDA